MTGTERIAAERKRQIDVEGWTAEHDDKHTNGELVEAAATYAYQALGSRVPAIALWPWDLCSWKPSENPVRNLEKAGALIAAEIDRLQRIENE